MMRTATPGPTLRELQTFLIGALRREAPIQEDAALTDASRVFVSGNDRLTPAEQADLYREQFWLRHLDSLSTDYPGVRAIVGEEAFEALGRAYLGAHPPCAPSLRDLGAELIPFARRFEGLEALPGETRAAALEMLAYEARFIDLFDGADVPPLDAAKLQSIGEDAWEGARVVLHPLLARLHVGWAVHTFRLAVLNDEERGALPERRDVNLVLYRNGAVDHVIRYDEIDADAFALLERLGEGVALGAACESIVSGREAEAAEAFVGKVGAWFQDWTAKGWIVDVVTASAS